MGYNKRNRVSYYYPASDLDENPKKELNFKIRKLHIIA